MTHINKTNVLIVGGGPAGSIAAYFLAKAGINVAIVEKEQFPFDKPCGGGLTANSVDILQEYGFTKEFEQLVPHFKYSGYKIYSSKNTLLTSPIHSKSQNYGYILNRGNFDNYLLNKAINAGAKVLMPIKALSAKKNSDGLYIVKLSNNNSIEAKIIIAADGSGGSFSRHVAPNYCKPEAIAIRGYYENVSGLTKDMEFFIGKNMGYGYAWIFPLNNTTANIGAGADIKRLKKAGVTVKQFLESFLNQDHFKDNMKNASLKGKLETFPLKMTFSKQTLLSDRILFVGDSADLIYPLTGEGISYAMKSGEFAAKAIIKTLNDKLIDYKKLEIYSDLIKKELGDFKLAHRMKEMFSNQKIQNFLFDAASKDKDLAKMAVGIHEHAIPATKFFRPSVWGKILKKGFFTKS